MAILGTRTSFLNVNPIYSLFKPLRNQAMDILFDVDIHIFIFLYFALSAWRVLVLWIALCLRHRL